ncbi:MAG: 3-oxoacyl-[acyl-carrier-protein] reductase [Victivallaceae bacterium]|nr:3-oxoacyl-[acyl-carrier-protein] reductase [Victivallaceae bacterium]
MKRLENKVALVTGSTRGIGRAICQRLAEEGAAVAVVGRSPETVEKIAQELRDAGFNARGYAADVAKSEDAKATVAKVVADFGRLDILVNNAGITKDNLMLRMSEEEWDAVMNVNLKGTFNFTQAAVRPMMKQRSGKIVNLASVVGRMGNVGQANYAASKAGVIALTKTTAKEFASRNIQCNAVAPGFVMTDMTAALSDDVRAMFLKVIPAGRAGSPEDIAGVVAFLASGDADYVTGQVINIDGGMLM